MPSILFDIKGSVGCIKLNRPEKLNAFNREMALEMIEALNQCTSKAIRAVYITGNGKGFSAGQDLEEVVDPKGPGMKRILSEQFNPIVTKIRKIEKPVVAAVNGIAAGAGANIALCCDIVVAAKSAGFIQAFSKIGLIPDSGGTYILPRLIGWQKASALMMLGDKVSAEEAERLNMIYKVFDDDRFEAESFRMAEQLSKMPTKGLAYTKQILRMSCDAAFEEQIHDEDIFQQQAAATDDFKEGVKAFMEKRTPVFKGE